MKCEKCGRPDIWNDYDGVTLCEDCKPKGPCFGYVPSFSGQWGGGLQWFTTLDRLIAYGRTVASPVKARFVIWNRRPVWRIRVPYHALFNGRLHDLGFIADPTPEQVAELRRIEEPPLKGEISAWTVEEAEP